MALVDQLAAFTSGPDAEKLTAESEIEGVICAPSKPSRLKNSITFQCPWRIPSDGTGRHCRALVRALTKAGVAVKLDDSGPRQLQLSHELPHDAQALEYLTHMSSEQTLLIIKHLVFSNPETLRTQLMPVSTGFVDMDVIDSMLARTILYTPWERDRVDPDSVYLMNKLASVWVPCAANRVAFVTSGVAADKVKVIPYCYDPHEIITETYKDGDKELVRRFPGVSSIPMPFGHDDVPTGKRFYSIGRWEPRKNQHRVLGAFLTAFTPKDKASLLIKTHAPFKYKNYPEPSESIEYWLEDESVKKNGWTSETFRRRVRVVSRKVSEEDIVEIHRSNNIYVSASHGEAWDIPAFEAKLAGNRMIYTNWGGPPEYASQEDIALTKVWAPVDPEYNWGDAQWAEISTGDLVAAMREVKAPQERWQDRQLYSEFSDRVVGAVMHGALESVLWKLTTDFHDGRSIVPEGWG